MNLLWGAAGLRGWRAFRACLARPRETQEQLLLACLATNRETAFGRAHSFARIRSVEEYRDAVPVSAYEDLQPLLERIAGGEHAVLTDARVERLVPTGGSTAAAKLVPFTAQLRTEFSIAVDAWIVDLFLHRPELLRGPAYWSITPMASVGDSAKAAGCALPIGFEDDSMYLGGTRQALARAVLAVPSLVGRLRNADAFFYATILFLLRTRELRLISVWHPSFLERLFDTWLEHRDRLIDDIGAGAFTPPGTVDAVHATAVLTLMRADSCRAAELRRVRATDIQGVWPKLTLISCWMDGLAAGAARQLAARVPGVALQPKGLLATEGVVTIPFAGFHPLAIRSHFFEFVDGDGGVHLAHELRRGAEYTVLLTTGGGLYRYRLGDRVKVDDFVFNTPSLRFIGRDARVSDWCGEKLTDGFVSSVLQSVFNEAGVPRFAMLAPEGTPPQMAYTLFVDAEALGTPRLAQRLEGGLRRNPQYAWCVDAGQLRPARVAAVRADAPQAYIDACVARGQRIGDVKPAALRSETDWAAVLCSNAPPREVTS